MVSSICYLTLNNFYTSQRKIIFFKTNMKLLVIREVLFQYIMLMGKLLTNTFLKYKFTKILFLD